MTPPLVSVITVTKDIVRAGREKMLQQCIESVQQQTYQPIEHIVIDGASDDGTIRLLEEYRRQSGVKFVSEPDSGIYNAMNKGIGMANGKYLLFLNSDDFLHETGGIAATVEMLERTNSEFSYGATRVVDEGGDPVFLDYPALGSFICCNPFCHQSMVVSTNVVRELGGFDEHYKMLADYDLTCRIILSGHKGVYVPCVYTSFRISGFSNNADTRYLIDEERGMCHRVYYEKWMRPEDVKRLKLGLVPADLLEVLRAYVHPALYPAVAESYERSAFGFAKLEKRVVRQVVKPGAVSCMPLVAAWKLVGQEKSLRKQRRKYAMLARLLWGKRRRRYSERLAETLQLLKELESIKG